MTTRPANAPPRTISVIMDSIVTQWGSALETDGYAALPYVRALQRIETIGDMHEGTTGEALVRGFLANAYRFKGEQARHLKEELRAHLPRRYPKR